MVACTFWSVTIDANVSTRPFVLFYLFNYGRNFRSGKSVENCMELYCDTPTENATVLLITYVATSDVSVSND